MKQKPENTTRPVGNPDMLSDKDYVNAPLKYKGPMTGFVDQVRFPL